MVDQSSVAMGVPSWDIGPMEGGFPKKLLSEQASQQEKKGKIKREDAGYEAEKLLADTNWRWIQISIFLCALPGFA